MCVFTKKATARLVIFVGPAVSVEWCQRLLSRWRSSCFNTVHFLAQGRVLMSPQNGRLILQLVGPPMFLSALEWLGLESLH